MKPFRVGKVTIGGKRPAFILGPCVIESEKFVWRMAREIAKICKAEIVNAVVLSSRRDFVRRTVNARKNGRTMVRKITAICAGPNR